MIARHIFLLLFMPPLAFGQTSETLTGSTGVRVLKGTLLLPASPSRTVVLIIARSGPTDRNGNQVMLQSDYLKKVAEELQTLGIASFRYDKRGVGESRMTNANEEAVLFNDFVADAVAWIKQLKSDKRFKKIIVLGHSEGSLVGMLACQRIPPAGFISIAGIGRPLDAVLKEQLTSNPYNSTGIIDQSFMIIDSLKAGHRVKRISPILSALFRPSVQPFLISVFQYNPAVEIGKLKIPVQIVQGTTDIQVAVCDAELLRAAQPTATFSIIPEMNHVLREAPADRMLNLSTYSRGDLPLAPGLVPALVSFIQSFAT